ncbi:hypothetical protein ONS95_004536 [Cadophora gregata]|uniref:uncharacterized protein n=1 Tax=Cadophora gregata TaxID=51156 RepID=UPI0026DBBD1C|nr:uncharacterized protein ONS95_004536 [Cadophora gregata]KAK0105101.1 hypothetical protein ONS96_004504 [Cadophora gregata f. sp. sojae]KAK0106030.1 hypothetical protein ONS95_004536 [Cadophora gregata]
MQDLGLCEICPQIDFKRHIYGDNGFRYRVPHLETGTIHMLRERSTGCAVCYVAYHSFGKETMDDLRCHLYATDFCMCPIKISDEHEERLVCEHPKHIVFTLNSKPPRYAGFQICLDRRAKRVDRDINIAGFVESTDDSCFTGRAVADKADLRPKNFLVIDVEQKCIISAPPDCRFVALSYVWGSAKQKKLTRKNWDVLSQPGALDADDVPATIWDTILLTRSLGEIYCWIDALCIFQNDPASQQDQISQMGAIYSRALVTIVNTAGDGSTGLPGMRVGTRNLQHIKIRLRDFDLVKAHDDVDIYGDSRHNISMWEKRAWTYQERIFSRRLIIFRKKQIYWHCRSATFVEEKILETRGPPTVLASMERMITRLPEIPRNLADYTSRLLKMKTIDDKEYHLYRSFVKGYTVRQLSYGSDALNAFAGVSRALSLLGKAEYIWGLPKSSFSDALTWSAKGLQKNPCLQNILRRDGTIVQLPFPSWCWASRTYSTSTEYVGGIDCFERGIALAPHLIIFYSCLTDGGVVRITQVSDDSEEGSQPKPAGNSMTSKWLGYPRIHNTLKPTSDLSDQETIHSGELKFWSSVATVYLFTEKQRLRGKPRTTFLSSRGSILMASAHLDSNHYRSPEDSRVPKQVREADLRNIQGKALEGDCHITILDLVIVHGEITQTAGGISGLSSTGRVLRALAVGWEDGVAIREGFVLIAEEHWVGLENREWKLVTMR